MTGACISSFNGLAHASLSAFDTIGDDLPSTCLLGGLDFHRTNWDRCRSSRPLATAEFEHDRDAPSEPWLNDERITEGQDQPSGHSSSPARADHLGWVSERVGCTSAGWLCRVLHPHVSGQWMAGSAPTPSASMARRGRRRPRGRKRGEFLREVVKGADPMADKLAERGAITVAELCQQYMADVEAGRLLTRRKAAKTESTLISDRGRIARHIIPLLGRMPVASVTRNDIEALHARCRCRQDSLQAEDQATRSVGRSWWAWCRQSQRWAARCDLHLCRSQGSSVRQPGTWHRPVRRWTTATTADQ